MPGFSEIVVSFLRFGLLINQLIPISLYVTLEVVKVVQCTFLGWDRHMYHAGEIVPGWVVVQYPHTGAQPWQLAAIV